MKIFVYALIPRNADDSSPKPYERHHHGAMATDNPLPMLATVDEAAIAFPMLDLMGAWARVQRAGKGVVEVHLDGGLAEQMLIFKLDGSLRVLCATTEKVRSERLLEQQRVKA